jgi:hypothetical protein
MAVGFTESGRRLADILPCWASCRLIEAALTGGHAAALTAWKPYVMRITHTMQHVAEKFISPAFLCLFRKGFATRIGAFGKEQRADGSWVLYGLAISIQKAKKTRPGTARVLAAYRDLDMINDLHRRGISANGAQNPDGVGRAPPG